MRDVRSTIASCVAAGCFLMIPAFIVGCAEPIPIEVYSRTPDAETKDMVLVSRVGMGAETWAIGKPFSNYASKTSTLSYVGPARPENLHSIDCQVELIMTFEFDQVNQANYCLGRLIANIYNPDHSVLIDRVVFFQEAMYTAKSSNALEVTHDGKNARTRVKEALFDDLIEYLSS